jgi:uncharacterized protein (TIGR03435 family)
VVSIRTAENCGNTAPGVLSKIPGGTRYEPGGHYITCSQLIWIIMDAYRLDTFSQPTGGPGWIGDDLFRIEAKAEGNPSKDQMRLMVQSLLEERFKLRTHLELRKTPVYLLTIAKGGPRLQPAKDEQGNLVTSLPSAEEVKKKWEEMKAGKSLKPGDLAVPGSYSIAGKPSGHEFTARALTMARFADALFTDVGRRKVIDKTGLAGFYDFKLASSGPNPAAADEFSAPVIFTAIQEQLGLRLVPDEAQREFMVIDNIEKPSPN